jgi:hypothetical protein
MISNMDFSIGLIDGFLILVSLNILLQERIQSEVEAKPYNF